MKKLVLLFLLLCIVPSQAQVRAIKLPELQAMTMGKDTLYVVNFWSTWCKPCMQELPSFDSLSRQIKGPVKLILVSLDFTENLKTKVEPVIKNNHITATCVLLDETDANTFIPAIHKNWSGSIPVTVLYYNGTSAITEKKMQLDQIKSMMANFVPGTY
jgi:thiol-disulfide isomerase/thioredoxin